MLKEKSNLSVKLAGEPIGDWFDNLDRKALNVNVRHSLDDYTSRVSFWGKCFYLTDGKYYNLVSYSTLVIQYDSVNKVLYYNEDTFYSMTTRRHVSAFLYMLFGSSESFKIYTELKKIYNKEGF